MRSDAVYTYMRYYVCSWTAGLFVNQLVCLMSLQSMRDFRVRILCLAIHWIIQIELDSETWP